MDHERATERAVLSAVAGQHASETIASLRYLAAKQEGDINVAAYSLGRQLKETVTADVLAQVLATVLIDQAREAEMPRLNVLDQAMAGVEIRAIGPEVNVQVVLKAMADAGIPAHDQRGPYDATDRPHTVRYYTYTDGETARAVRQRRSNTHRRGAGRTDK